MCYAGLVRHCSCRAYTKKGAVSKRNNGPIYFVHRPCTIRTSAMYETSCFDTAAPCVGYSPVALECGTHSDGECAFLHKVLLLLLHSPSVLVSGSECKIAVLEGDAAAQLTRDAPPGLHLDVHAPAQRRGSALEREDQVSRRHRRRGITSS